MMIHRISLVVTLLSFVAFKSRAQNYFPIKSTSVFLEIIDTYVAGDNDSIIPANVNLKAILIVELFDTTNVSTIAVKFGNVAGNPNYLNKSFSYLTQGVFSDGTSYRRDKNILYFNMGIFQGLNNFYAEVQTSNLQNELSNPLIYIK